MPADHLGVQERAALLALMAQARAVPNPELEQLTGFRLSGSARLRLAARQLIESERREDLKGRPFAHRLTAEGWRWCATELGAERPARSGSAGGALYAVLAGLSRYLARSGLDLREVFGSGPAGGAPAQRDEPAPDLPERVRQAYRKLAREPRDLVSLTQLRPLLGGAPREAVDAALRQLSRARQANLVPQANQKILSQADRAAAVRIGNEDCHFISIEDS
jgi:hypothetical protein